MSKPHQLSFPVCVLFFLLWGGTLRPSGFGRVSTHHRSQGTLAPAREEDRGPWKRVWSNLTVHCSASETEPLTDCFGLTFSELPNSEYHFRLFLPHITHYFAFYLVLPAFSRLRKAIDVFFSVPTTNLLH